MKFLQLDWSLNVFPDSRQYKLDKEWPKANNEKVNFSQCAIN